VVLPCRKSPNERTLESVSNRMPRHHELPRYYLRGFCEPSTSFVWVFERGGQYAPGVKYGNNPRKLGLRKAGLRPDGYIAWNRDGTPHFKFERALQQQERVADHAIAKAREFQLIDVQDKVLLARYIALIWRRNCTQEADILRIVEAHVAESNLPLVASKFANVGKFCDARGILEEMAWLQSEAGKTELLRETILSAFDLVHGAFMQLKWVFWRAVGNIPFVTCDGPVAYDRAEGLKRSPLLFPISQHVLLVATWSGGEDLVWKDASAVDALHFNEAVISRATRYVYASSADRGIQRCFRATPPGG
jgi:hypothetical protein